MNRIRRRLLGAAAMLTPLGSAATTPTEEHARFLKVRRVGLVARPCALFAAVADGANMWATGGANAALARDLLKAMGTRIDEFPVAMRRQLGITLREKGFDAVDVPFLANASFFSSPYGADEPFYLDCRTDLQIAKLPGGEVMPNAAILANLIAGKAHLQVHTLYVGYDFFNPAVDGDRGAGDLPAERFASFDAAMSSAEAVANMFVSWAPRYGKRVGEAFAKQIENTSSTGPV